MFSQNNSLKEKLSGTLGAFGVILFIVLQLIVSIFPFLMIDLNSIVLTFILIAIDYFVPITTIVFWIWGLVCTINGVQDIWAILYYIAFVIVWLPMFISTVKSMFSKQ